MSSASLVRHPTIPNVLVSVAKTNSVAYPLAPIMETALLRSTRMFSP
jgi:hypothetical protein